MNRIAMLLTLITEECAEVAQRSAKAVRFGLDEVQEGQSLTNAERLRLELNDLDAVRWMLEQEVGTSFSPCPNLIAAKVDKVERYLAYSVECGQLDEGASREPTPIRTTKFVPAWMQDPGLAGVVDDLPDIGPPGDRMPFPGPAKHGGPFDHLGPQKLGL